MNWMFLPHPKVGCVKTLIPNGMVFGNEAFGRGLVVEGGTLMMELVPF